MKFLLVGDLHEQETTPRSRADDFQASKNAKIEEILHLKKQLGVDHILQTGDFFDTVKYDNNFLMKQFLLWCQANSVAGTELSKENLSLIEAYKSYPSMIGVLGNHEMPGGNFNKEMHKQTPYHLFEKIGIPLMQFVTKENPIIFTTEDGLKIAITGTNYHLDIDKPGHELDYIVEEKLGDVHIHIVHGYLTDKYKGKMFHHTLVKDIAHQTKADITLTGHDHIGFDVMEVDGKYFLNPGAVLRLSNDKKEMKRTVKVVLCEVTKEKGIVFTSLPLSSAKDASVILDRQKIEKAKEKKKRLEDFKQKVRSGTNTSHMDIISFLNTFLENEELQFPKAVVDKAIARVAEKRIANAVTKPEVEPYKIVKVVLTNFESHKNTVLELDEHLNIIVGESGHGKSSLLRAIRWVVKNNPSGRDMVRIGESKTSVTLVLSNGYEITRYVTKSKNGYIVTDPDGTTTEYNTKALADIQGILGFTQLKVDKDMVYDFNFSNQGDGWFLIGNQFTAPGRSKIIGSIYGTHYADAASREIKSEIISIRDQNKRLYDRKDAIEKELMQYEHLDDLSKQIAFLEDKITEINRMKKEKETLLNVLKRFEYKQAQLMEAEQTLKQLPDIAQLQLMYFHLKEQYQVKEQLLKNTELAASIQAKKANAETAIQQTENLEKHQNLVSRMKAAEEKKQKLKELHGNFTSKQNLLAKELLTIKETDALQAAHEKFGELKKQSDLKEKIQALIPSYQTKMNGLTNINLTISGTNQLEKAKQLMSALHGYVDHKEKILVADKKYKDIQTNIKKELSVINEQTAIMEKAIDEYNEELRISKACPTCFAPITEETTQRILTKFKGGI